MDEFAEYELNQNWMENFSLFTIEENLQNNVLLMAVNVSTAINLLTADSQVNSNVDKQFVYNMRHNFKYNILMIHKSILI